jgi:membrane-bound metal-dependent hydrolase YbcI (DUF457 family)
VFIGHSAIAFSIGVIISYLIGYEKRRSIGFGLVAGAFAVVPDLDMGYAFIGLMETGITDISTLQQEFWDSGLVVHRGITHSLVIGVITAFSFGLTQFDKKTKLFGFLLLLVVLFLTLIYEGPLEFAVMVTFSTGGVLVASITEEVGFDRVMVLCCSFIGILSHPFGDIFTGTSPRLLYPLNIRILPERVIFSSDPTVNFLVAFGIELLAIWIGFAVYIKMRDKNIRTYIHYYVATIGLFYSLTVVVLPPPTLSVSYHFVFTAIILGLFGILAEVPNVSIRSKSSRRRILLTGLSVITIALSSYFVSYLVLNFVL